MFYTAKQPLINLPSNNRSYNFSIPKSSVKIRFPIWLRRCDAALHALHPFEAPLTLTFHLHNTYLDTYQAGSISTFDFQVGNYK